MYLVIVGGGDTGKALAIHLVGEGHEVVIIEEDEKRARILAEELDALVIHGDGSNTEILKDAGIDKADAVAIMTHNDNTNLTVCQMAKKFNVARIVARVNDSSKKDLYLGLEITAAISPITALVSYFKNALVQESGSRSISSIANGNAEVIELKLGNTELDGKKIKDLGLPTGCILAVIYRNGEVIICEGNTIIRKDDILTVVTKTDIVKDVLIILKG
ncbi:MAG: NAD-binding protein [Candidatus Altiarchaeota archaeon]